MNCKKIIALLLVFGMVVVMLPVSAAVQTLVSITLTSDITPTLNFPLRFSKAPTADKPGYTFTQIWSDGEKSFTDSSLTNLQLESNGELMPDNERILRPGKTYGYMIIFTPDGTKEFSENMTVKSGDNNLIKVNNEDGMYMYSILFYYDTKLHISSPVWKHNDTEHWLCCKDNDDFVFDMIKQEHDFDHITYTCFGCGYTVPENLATKITKQPTDKTVNCGETLELSVEAVGSNLKYDWEWGDHSHSLYDSENFYGMKISGSDTSKLKIENFGGKFAEEFKGIYCKVKGSRGKQETNIVNITAVHNKNSFEKVDGNGHNVICSCGKIVEKSQAHIYDNDKCTKCGYKRGTDLTQFKRATLYAPDFTVDKSVATALDTIQLDGFGISGIYKKELKYSLGNFYYSVLPSDTLDVNKCYLVKIYPRFENKYYLDEGTYATIVYNGIENKCVFYKDENNEFYFNVLIGNPHGSVKMTFEPNGGTGTQAPVYVDEYNDIFFPECTFTKTGDEFVAWKVGDKLHVPDMYAGYRIVEDTVATAVWKSQLTNGVAITMDAISDGKTPTDITFSVPTSSDYSFAEAVWYEEDSNGTNRRIKNNAALDMNKDYTVQIIIKGSGFVSENEMNVTLNNKTMTDVQRQGLQQVVITVKIINDVNVEFPEPMGGVPLAPASEMKTNSDRYSVVGGTTLWFDKPNANLEDKLNDGTEAILGKKYYLTLSLRGDKENQIFGGDTIRVNGKAYPITRLINTSGIEFIKLKPEFTAIYPQVKISEIESKSDPNGGIGTIVIESPTNMNVTFVAALYKSTGELIDVVIKPDYKLEKGNNNIYLTDADIAGMDRGLKFIRRYIGEKVKITVYRDTNSLMPLCSAYKYKYIYD